MDTLSILKYLGAIVAAVSAMVGIYNKLSAGQWRLTGADWFAIFLTVAGLSVSIVSIRVQDVFALRSAQQEHRRVLAHTPLRNLTIEWTFYRVPDQLWRQAAAGKPTDPCRGEWEQRRYGPRRDVFYPFLGSLATGIWHTEPAIVLLVLDESAANVLPLGMLDVNPSTDEPLDWNRTNPNRLKAVAATIDFRQDLEQCIDVTVHNLPGPAIDRPRRCEMRTEVKRDGDRVTLRWDLGPVCIAKALIGLIHLSCRLRYCPIE